MLAVLIVLWLAFGVGVGAYASSRGREFLLWFVVGLVISPLVAIVILAVIPEVKRDVKATPITLQAATARELVGRLEQLFDSGAVSAADHATIKVLAARQPVKPRSDEPAVKPTPVEFTRPCPACGGLVHPQATTCMHCWAKLPKLAA